jgi:hypothetical protein
MSRLLCKVIGVAILFSCKSNTRPDVTSLSIDTLTAPKDSTTNYFPTSNLFQVSTSPNKESLDSFTNEWYSYHLYALKEPVLKNYMGENEIYRFTWLRSFDHPITVRLQRSLDNIELTSKMTSGAGGYEAGKIIWDTTFTITKNQWNSVIDKVNKADFWQMPNHVYSGGKDGSEWILEGVRGKQHHWAARWSPVDTSSFRRACEYLLQLSNVLVDSERLY